ncbi:MAG: cytochrome c oxidase subunit II [Alphaproteobacteria bacterium]|nr:MAG: cytochrome c oxidase subunit II [Alphaproteobacteria bacterium]
MVRGAVAAAFFGLAGGAAFADQPVPKGLGLQPAVTPIAERAFAFHNDLLLPIIAVIVIVVLALLLWILVRYNRRANPDPSRTTHNTLLEVVWTVVPIGILLVIAVPSFRILTFEETIPPADFTIKATGNQWFWTYEYPDQGGFVFDAYMTADADLKPGEPRLLATDNHIVVPAGATVKLLVTASDVLHSWAVPAFGVKIDAVPGRLNQTWFKVDKEGVYYGQCSELCGKNHGFMPITVEVVSPPRFEEWVKAAQQRFADGSPAPGAVRLAAR